MSAKYGAISLNALAAPLVDDLIARATLLRVEVKKGMRGQTLIDAGATARGGLEAGLRIAQICMAGLGRVSLSANPACAPWEWTVEVQSSHPVLACLASQYAGWSLSHSEGGDNYYVLGSGPGRAVAAKEELFAEIGYRDNAGRAIFVIEADQPPPPALIDRIADDCRLAQKDLTFIYAPTQSLAGSLQVVARVLEVALHKAHALKFPLDRIVDGAGAAPYAPPAPDFVAAMGRTNDAIIYGGRVHLFVTGPDSDAKDLAQRLPSSASKDFGKPFAEVFKAVDGDFYKIDAMLFSPAAVTVTAVESGKSFFGGGLAMGPLNASFG
ncbi:MAG: methenyltetrahydromethanopterin cyclohydrolase [Hyphomicrobiales bacterium]|nr:methenyltetrahydromethanopterin cyclohydrolase [Hyphomicrobiales bacterium]